ncbi:MFS transporter, partial [Sphingomonas sp. 3F27E9-B]
GGASLLAVENAPPGWANRYGSFPPMGAPVGFIFANGFFLILGAVMDDAQFREWGWRLPFLASAVLVFLGLWVRLKITETPEFVAATEKEAPPAVPIGELFRTSALATFAGTMGTVACFALFYISTVFIIGYGTKTLGYDRETFLAVELLAILFMAAGIVTAGISADRRTANSVLIFGCVFTIPVGMAMALLLVPGSLASVAAWLAFALFVMGFVYGPLGGWLPSLFPARVRYTGVSVTFNLGGILGGGLTPMIAETLVKQGGLAWVGYYLAGAGMLSLVGLILIRNK